MSSNSYSVCGGLEQIHNEDTSCQAMLVQYNIMQDNTILLREGIWEIMCLKQPFKKSERKATANFKGDFIQNWRCCITETLTAYGGGNWGLGQQVFVQQMEKWGRWLFMGIPCQFVTSQPCPLSLLPSMEWEVSTRQNEVLLCGWEVKVGAGSFHLWI